MRATDLAEKAGITFRQLDFWVRSGYVTCQQTKPPAPRRRGHGYPREFTDDEAAVVTLMGALTRAGITPAHAQTLARHLRAHGWADLGGGLRVSLHTTAEQGQT